MTGSSCHLFSRIGTCSIDAGESRVLLGYGEITGLDRVGYMVLIVEDDADMHTVTLLLAPADS